MPETHFEHPYESFFEEMNSMMVSSMPRSMIRALLKWRSIPSSKLLIDKFAINSICSFVSSIDGT